MKQHDPPHWRDEFEPRHVQYRNDLRRGLAGKHEDLYRRSPSFKAAIDGMASLLPLMVNGLAAESREQDARQLAAVEMLNATVTPMPPLRPGPGFSGLRDSGGFPIPTYDPIDMAREAQGEQL